MRTFLIACCMLTACKSDSDSTDECRETYLFDAQTEVARRDGSRIIVTRIEVAISAAGGITTVLEACDQGGQASRIPLQTCMTSTRNSS